MDGDTPHLDLTLLQSRLEYKNEKYSYCLKRVCVSTLIGDGAAPVLVGHNHIIWVYLTTNSTVHLY